ncbi:immunoglobulin E-set [Hypomontagnella monticulosa]|nr:immunoglobulin E-set [Hypomontagnella monticulosa]
MDAEVYHPRRPRHGMPDRPRNLRHMISTPLMNRDYNITYSPKYHRYSEDADASILGPDLGNAIPVAPTILGHPESHIKGSLVSFLKAQLQFSKPKRVPDERTLQLYPRLHKKPRVRKDFMDWVKEKASFKLPRSPSSSSDGSGLDPWMTCRGCPEMMIAPETKASNTSASPSLLTSPPRTSFTQSPKPMSRSKSRKYLSNKNIPNVDANDESLQRYKQSLGLSGGKDLSDPNDPRVCIIHALTMESPGRAPVTIDLSAPGSESTLKDRPFKIKEGCKFTMVASFKVQHEILSGLQYVQVVKRKGIKVSKDSEMLGSYAPNTEKQPLYSKRFQEEEAPSGMLARGHYNATSSFVDDDKKTHLQFEWSFDIAKDW